MMSAPYRLFQGKDTRQIDGHTTQGARDIAWYWEPVTYEGDVLYSNPYESKNEAESAAQDAYDNGSFTV